MQNASRVKACIAFPLQSDKSEPHGERGAHTIDDMPAIRHHLLQVAGEGVVAGSGSAKGHAGDIVGTAVEFPDGPDIIRSQSG